MPKQKKDHSAAELSKEEQHRRMVLESIIQGRRMEGYVEHHAKDMHACWVCGTICYKKKPMKNIGEKWICIDCLKQLKDVLDTLTQWEKELTLEKEMEEQLGDDLIL